MKVNGRFHLALTRDLFLMREKIIFYSVKIALELFLLFVKKFLQNMFVPNLVQNEIENKSTEMSNSKVTLETFQHLKMFSCML